MVKAELNRRQRNSTVEALRIVSMFLIMWFHFCGRQYGLFGGYHIASGGYFLKT